MSSDRRDFGAQAWVEHVSLPLHGTTILLRDWTPADLERCASWLLQEPRLWDLNGDCQHPLTEGHDGIWLDVSDPRSWPEGWPRPQDYLILGYPGLWPTTERVVAFVARKHTEIATKTAPTPRASLVIADGDTDELLGVTSWRWWSPETYSAALDVLLYDPPSWGQGRGYQALGLWTDYLLQALPWLTGLALGTWAGNHAMRRIAQKVGYTLWSRTRLRAQQSGAPRIDDTLSNDTMSYEMRPDEWMVLYPQGFATHLTTRIVRPGRRRDG